MIVEWFMGLAAGAWGWISGYFPAITPENGVLMTAQSFVATLGNGAGQLGAWIPWPTLGICLAVVVPVYLGSMAVRLARTIVGHIPLVGGNG